MKRKPVKQTNFDKPSKYDYIQPLEAKPLEVRVYNNFERAMKAFRALVQKERILSLYKEKQSYEKPSDKKRRKRNEMKRKLLEIDAKNDPDYLKKKLKKDKKDGKDKLRSEDNYTR